MIGLILCAGKGVRLGEETKDKPKCMIPVAGKPILEHIADHMSKHGIWRIVVNLHAFPEVVMRYFCARFLYLYELVPMGEFATVALVRAMFPDEVLVTMNGDTLTDIDLTEVSNRKIPGQCIDDKTKRHMGTTIYYPGWSEAADDMSVNCEYFDIGTPEGLVAAKKHYEH